MYYIVKTLIALDLYCSIVCKTNSNLSMILTLWGCIMSELIRHRGFLGHEKIIYVIDEKIDGDYDRIDGEWIWCCE